MPLKPLEIFGLLAIVVAPIVTFFLPDDIKNQIVFYQISVKDFVLLFLVLLLALGILLLRLGRMVMNWLTTKAAYKSVEFNYFYYGDGTVVTRNRFDLVNGWKENGELPEESLVWHREISTTDLVYRLYERGSFIDRKMLAEDPRIEPVTPERDPDHPSDFRYSWEPRIKPPLRANEKISYVVEIVAEKTETAAFTLEGTMLGFGLLIPANKAHVTAYAPFGYRFVLRNPRATLRHTDTLEEVPGSARKTPRPEISPDGTILTLEVSRPKVGYRYWVHYRFEQASI